MHHVVLERWSSRVSGIHSRDARMKVLATLVFLVAVATTPSIDAVRAAGYGLFLMTGVLAAGLPLGGLLLRAATVLPFTGTFAIISAIAGEPERAVALVVKSYLSAAAVLLLAGTTPMPRLLDAMERLGVPRMMTLVVQFLYRYLFVISEQGQHMWQAARCRGEPGLSGRRASALRRKRFQAAAGAVAVLFGRSYHRAEAIQRSMLSRGFGGRIIPLTPPRARWTDFVFLGTAAAIPLLMRFGWRAPL